MKIVKKLYGVSDFGELPTRPLFWWSVVIVCLLSEVAALFYQHVLNLLPCELCIYTRVWFASIVIFSILASFVCRFPWPRLLLTLLVFGLFLGLGNETLNLLEVEYGFGEPLSCSFFANFPAWAPLDKWIPFLFEVQELCQATPILFFGISMADALAVMSVFFIGLFAFLTFVQLRLLMGKK